MPDVVLVCCPWCFQTVELCVDPQTEGELVEDCEVCCRPWVVRLWRDAEGSCTVHVERGNGG